MKLDHNDINLIVRRLPKKLRDLMEEKKWAGKIFLGGGFIRGVIANEKINDIDLFVTDALDAGIIAGLLCQHKNDLHKTDNTLTIKGRIPIQIITRWLFSTGEAVSDSFDFTVCCASIWSDRKLSVNDEYKSVWKSYCDDRFYTDLASKRLVYRSPVRNEDAGGSMLRVLKYYQRGYRIPLNSLSAVIVRLISKIDFGNTQCLNTLNSDGERLINQEYINKIITGLLREVDPNIDIEHESHLPSSSEENDNTEG